MVSVWSFLLMSLSAGVWTFWQSSVSLKFGSVRAVIMHAVSRRRFILITFLFVCFLVNRCWSKVIVSTVEPPCATTAHMWPPGSGKTHTFFPSQIPIIRTSRKRPPPKSDCDYFLAWKLYYFQYCFQHLVGNHCTWRMVSSLMKVLHYSQYAKAY